MAEQKRYPKDIHTQLTDEQIAECKDRLVAVENNIDDETKGKREEITARNLQLKGLREERKRLLDAIAIGVLEETIEVYERRSQEDPEKIEILRVDNDQFVDDREMTAEEKQRARQGTLPLGEAEGEGNGTKAGAAKTPKGATEPPKDRGNGAGTKASAKSPEGKTEPPKDGKGQKPIKASEARKVAKEKAEAVKPKAGKQKPGVRSPEEVEAEAGA